uniref:Ubiquitin-like protease family profile domain-containing protein n=1 Tax=viral metagenome TaxID=1070528 RepID=A0A6C0CG70_9ZZZZ
MAKNKLAMVDKKTKKKNKKSKTKKKITKKLNIVDVPLADKVSLGSKASIGSINYHYQKYYNTFAFIQKIISRDDKLKKIVCIPDKSKWLPSFMKVHFFTGIDSIKSHLESVKPVDPFVSKDNFMNELNKCMVKRLVPISLEIVIPNVGTHANVIIIDTKKKTVELFEPHGARSNESELESISRAYFKVSKNVHKFVRMNLPEFTYIPPSKYEPEDGLQVRLDAFSGLCVTWSILYLHYRILNPDLNPKKLMEYLDKTFTMKKMLRYTRYVEEVLKGKI